jgi:hypothetical protein
MKYIFSIIFLTSVFSSSANSKTITINKWTDVTNEMLPEAKPVKSECKKLEFAEESASSYKPEFPGKALKRTIQGYSILEFTIDSSGKTLLTQSILSTDKIFEKQAISSLENLKFVSPINWESTCADQVYRIGYAFKLLSSCTGKEFQKPTISICTMGMIQYYKDGKWEVPNVYEK